MAIFGKETFLDSILSFYPGFLTYFAYVTYHFVE